MAAARKTAEPKPLALINDEPVVELGDDRLSLDPFANTVAAVVLGTAGPFTVGIFGDWGHGKTSLLRLVQARVKEQGGDEGQDQRAHRNNSRQQGKEQGRVT